MNEKDMTQIKESITMPSEMAETLLRNCTQSCIKHYRYRRYSRICAGLAIIFCIGAIGSTSLAAYNVYQEKQLAIFMDYDLTQEEIDALGDALTLIPDITSCRYVSADEAWEDFKTTYFDNDPDLISSFTGNPLADSYNYQVSVRLGADTQAVREQISCLAGVRKITTIREWEKMEKDSASY